LLTSFENSKVGNFVAALEFEFLGMSTVKVSFIN
jgi:hypothetical protein